jgi:hypothetical protein
VCAHDSIAGHVFDVTNGREFYGQGGGYEFFTFRDGSRAFTTGDFTEARGVGGWVDGWLSIHTCGRCVCMHVCVVMMLVRRGAHEGGTGAERSRAT